MCRHPVAIHAAPRMKMDREFELSDILLKIIREVEKLYFSYKAFKIGPLERVLFHWII